MNERAQAKILLYQKCKTFSANALPNNVSSMELKGGYSSRYT